MAHPICDTKQGTVEHSPDAAGRGLEAFLEAVTVTPTVISRACISGASDPEYACDIEGMACAGMVCAGAGMACAGMAGDAAAAQQPCSQRCKFGFTVTAQ